MTILQLNRCVGLDFIPSEEAENLEGTMHMSTHKGHSEPDVQEPDGWHKASHTIVPTEGN